MNWKLKLTYGILIGACASMLVFGFTWTGVLAIVACMIVIEYEEHNA